MDGSGPGVHHSCSATCTQRGSQHRGRARVALRLTGLLGEAPTPVRREDTEEEPLARGPAARVSPAVRSKARRQVGAGT